jgi:hypothetical protein
LAILKQNETPKKLSKRQKIDKLVALIFSGKTNMTENAEAVSISRTTAYRYWNKWLDSEEAQQVDIEWWAMFKKLKQKSRVKAFEGLTRLKYRKTPEKHELKEKIEVSEKVDISILAQYDLALRRAAERDIVALRAKQQMDTENSQASAT